MRGDSRPRLSGGAKLRGRGRPRHISQPIANGPCWDVEGILGKKVGMTQLFDDKGDVHPATVLQAGPCVITQHKTETRDGYPAAQIGMVEFVKESRLTQPMKGHLGKHNL